MAHSSSQGTYWIVAGALLAVASIGGWAMYRLVTPPVPADEPPAPPSVRPATMPGVSPAASSHHPVGLPAPESCPILFTNATDGAGITFRHADGSSGRRYVVETMSAGLATLDYDLDGLIDLYFPSGGPLPGAQYDALPHHALYRNSGNWRFEDVTLQAGVASTAYGMGVTVGDCDGDGWPDLYLVNFGPNVLYHNNQDGTFTDVTAQAGVAGTATGGALDRKVGAGASFLDADADGRLDLYVGNYMELDLETHVPRTEDGIPSYPSPLDYPPVPDTLYRNNGDGTFTDVSRESRVADYAGRSMGMIAADCDHDGDTDVFVCNDVQENFLLLNDGRGRFDQVGLLAGVAMTFDGFMVANMGVDCGDVDNDGRLDFYTTNYEDTFPMLFRNLGESMFEHAALATGATAGCGPHVNWGCGLVDFDNDGFKDIFVANGHTEDNIELRGNPATAYRAHNVLLWNVAGEKFVDVSEQCGVRATTAQASRGAAFDDLDNDGDVDVVVLNSREKPTLQRNMLNENGSTNHWLQIRLEGAKSNRGGVGAQVRIVAGDLVQIDEVHSGRGYQSHWGSRLHFGLGRHDRVDRIEVRWIGGGTDVLEEVAVDRLIVITEGAAGAGASS